MYRYGGIKDDKDASRIVSVGKGVGMRIQWTDEWKNSKDVSEGPQV